MVSVSIIHGNEFSLAVNPGVGFQGLISWGLRCLSRKFMSYAFLDGRDDLKVDKFN